MITSKQCTKCNIIKEYTHFHRDVSNPTGYNSWCKVCIKEKDACKYANNKEELGLKARQRYKNNREKNISRHKIYYENNKEKVRAYANKYYQENKEKEKERHKKYLLEHPTFARDVQRKRRQNPVYRLHASISSSIYSSLLLNSLRKNNNTYKYTGKTAAELMEYLETLFKEGMTRNNQGQGEGKWHVDHIKPITAFDKQQENWIYECFNYNNLQPLWSEDNISKSSVYEGKRHRRK
jgi:hypothetical protein